MNLIITNASAVARAIGCTPQRLRHNARENIWTFVRVVPPEKGKTQCRYYTVATELAKYLGISMEELEKRIKGEED